VTCPNFDFGLSVQTNLEWATKEYELTVGAGDDVLIKMELNVASSAADGVFIDDLTLFERVACD